MKTTLHLSFMMLFVLLFQVPAMAVESGKIRREASEKTSSVSDATPDKKEQRKQKRMDRWQEKWEAQAENARGLTDRGGFRLGLLLMGAGILLGILAGLGILKGLLSLTGGLAFIVGLVLVIIELVDFYA